MAKWVTYYWSIMNGATNIKIHNNKEDATEYFKNHYRSYFELSSKIEVKLPMTYGYSHRYFGGMSLKMFEKRFGVESQESEDKE